MIKLNPKIWAVIVPIATLLAGYFGFEPVQELRQPSSSVTVNIPEHPVQKYSHQDWLDALARSEQKSEQKAIKRAIEKDNEHIDKDH